MRKSWETLVGEITAMCTEVGIEWYELRNEIGRREVESGSWPEGEGMGSSDMNCMTVGEWESDPAGLRRVAEDIKRTNDLRADLVARGVDLERMARLFAPA